MDSFEGKVAVITGAAGGLGLALARQCADRGMRLVLADLDAAALEAAVARFGGPERCLARPTDVTRADEVEALARAAEERFGAVHLLFNNAGVGVSKTIAETTANDWRWVLGVNLWGVLHGIAAFLPGMAAHGGEGRIVNTASAAGFLSEPCMGAYSVSKHAVVVVSETLRKELELERSRIGVTVLGPAFFPTGIIQAERSRPPELASPPPASALALAAQARLEKAVLSGRLGADEIAARALDAVQARAFYVFTHAKIRLGIEERMRAILGAFPAT